MKHYDLRLFVKCISPFANVIADALHIPGGATGFSLMFPVIAAVLVLRMFCAAVMGAVQSGLALALPLIWF